MDTYKDFIHRLTKITFDDVYLLFSNNICPKLKESIVLLLKIQFEDGDYHEYYGEVKIKVSSFCSFYAQSIHELNESDKYRINVTKEDLLAVLERTANIYQINHIEYGREFLPITNSMEKDMYDDIEVKLNEHMNKLKELGEKIQRLDINKPNNIDEFAREQLNISIQRTCEIFAFTHGYISTMLSDVTHKIRISLEEIHLRLHHNLIRLEEKNEQNMNALMQELYEKNKEQIFLLCRQSRQSITQEAEVSRSLDIIKEKLNGNTDYLRIKARIEEELASWQRRLADLKVITDTISGLMAKQEDIIKQEEIYNNIRRSEPPGPKFSCWEEMGEKFRQRKEYLREKISEARKMMITFFSFRGTNRIFYKDRIGPYHVDEFNHQIYVFDNGLRIFHLNCEGEFIAVPENAKYYFDENGRYIFANGEKVYQCAPCTSKYKLNDDNLLTKITKDCGHSERDNIHCRMKIKNNDDVEILPKTDILDIKKTQSPEVVKYLWDNFGKILPDVLHDLGMSKPKNPIHRLAHSILRQYHNKTANQLNTKLEEAQAYSAAIYKQRNLKAEKGAKTWKAKQVRRRKPEESDNAQELAVYEAHLAEQKRIESLNYYNDPC